MVKVDSISSNIIKDSRGERTIEAVIKSGNLLTKASIPCGKSKGTYEAFCHTPERSTQIIQKISLEIRGQTFQTQAEFDNFLIHLDASENKNNLGVNVTLSLSIAFCRLLALINNQEVYETIAAITSTQPKNFPRLFFNIINGGLHVEKSFCPLPFQEYMLVPKTTSPKEAVGLVFAFIEKLKESLISNGLLINYGDEGGFIIKGEDPELGFQHFQKIIDLYAEFKDKFDFGLDVASSSLLDKTSGNYNWKNDEFSCNWTSEQLAQVYQNLFQKYPLISIEDPFDQESWGDWTKLKNLIGDKIWLVGDDLTVTNVKRLEKAKEENAINAVLIKPNQIGTLTETFSAVDFAKENNWKVIVSHRSGETHDDFIADLAYGIGADGLKAGSPAQSERLAKYERLKAIEETIKI